MSGNKQREAHIDELINPHILTLGQAIAVFETTVESSETSRQNSAKAVYAVRNRVTCRFSGPTDFGRLTFGERMVWDLTYMQGEVLNGGFHQYLTNSTGETGEAVKKYLTVIDAEETLALFARLSAIFPGSKIPVDHSRRCAFVQELEEHETGHDIFDSLDGLFYKQSEDLNALIISYARNHRNEFEEPTDEIVTKFKRKNRILQYYRGQ